MAKRVGVDKFLYGAVVVLVTIGLLMVFSASAVVAEERYHSASTFVAKQAVWAVLGLIAMSVLMHVDYRKLNSQPLVFTSMGITLLVLIAVFAMHDSHHTHRWFRLGPLLSFQPSEIAKPVLILFLAWFLQNRVHAMDEWRSVAMAAGPVVVFAALILLEPDLGTTLVILLASAILLYLARMPWKYYGMAALASVPVFYHLLFAVGWRRARIEAFLHPDADPRGAGFHVMQSLIAVGTGGITGQGYMEGKQKLFYLPEPHTDFIFANLAEEVGLIGAIFVVALFGFLAWRGMRTALRASDPFAQFLVVGITSTIIIQACFNISVVLSLVPTKGIPLPFISSGGTSLFITMAMMGVLLNVTREIE